MRRQHRGKAMTRINEMLQEEQRHEAKDLEFLNKGITIVQPIIEANISAAENPRSLLDLMSPSRCAPGAALRGAG